MIEIKQLHHVSIAVKDVEKSKQFYCGVLGMNDVPRPEHYDFGGAWFRSDTYEVHLIQQNDSVQLPGDPPINPSARRDLTFARHFCFRVADMDEALKILEEKNIPIAAGPRPRGDGATQLYIYDPDGHFVELVYIPWLD
jgi:catechol 2,3-dioxygenase-like lactoylglutathione lyase family enzyme